MPAQRPRASFEPIAPDFDLSALVESMPNFQFVPRIACDMIDQQGMEAFDRLVHLHVVIGGKPLVIDGYQNRLDPWTFSSKWLQDNMGEKVETVRDLGKKTGVAMTTGHYLRNMAKLTNQYFERPENYRDKERQRMYLKDIDCPDVWQDKLKEHLPLNLFYFNDGTGEVAGPGSMDEPVPGGGKRRGRGIAPSGDLMSSLPHSMRAENIMCYIGHEGTYTPAHREMCASLGQNIMVETSDIVGEEGKPERPGSSIWFMTETNERHLVSEYWLSQLGHDIEVETHFAQIAAWKKAPFTTYVVEQKAGDLILIPPMAPHQVWNRGTRTTKAAWNRTTVETLDMALKEALPNARLVCRDEQYKNKAIIVYTLEKYSGLLARVRDQEQTATSPQEAASLRTSPKIKQLQKDFKRLFNMFKGILLSEMFDPEHPSEKNVQFNAFDSNITCAYCRGNIFNRFLTCQNCDYALNTTEAEPYDICMDCYAMGRSCGCISKLRWAEQFKWKELVYKYEHWRRQYIEIERGLKPTSPLPIIEERARLNEKTLAQICQEQLKRRPFTDVSKPKEPEPQDLSDDGPEIEVNDDGTVKKKRKRKSETWLKHSHTCHVCCHRHEKWKMAECKCGRWWCYGSLFRAHDLMPVDVMKMANWQCPHCLGICNAGACRKDPRQNPYKPQRTLLGHDTKKVADARSIESLVDFSVSNLGFINETSKEAPRNNERLAARLEEAERAKAIDASELDPYNSEHEQEVDGIHYDTMDVIDPALGGGSINHTPRLPKVANMSGPTELPGYEPAITTGYVDPSAVLYRPPDEEDAEGDAEYPGIDDLEMEGTSRPKRKGNDRRPMKKRQKLDDLPISDAKKQYRKEQERKAIEEARKQGRFIQVHATLKGKSKVVKLRLPQHLLLQLERGGRNSIDGAADEANVLLRSDIAPPKPAAEPKTRNPDDKPEKASKVRIRVEHDEDFAGGRRRGHRKSTDGKKKKGANIDYEEVDIPTEEDEEVQDDGLQLDKAVKRTEGGGKKRRISAWQKKHHDDDDDDAPVELTPNAHGNSKVAQKQPRKPDGKSIPQIRPPIALDSSCDDEEDAEGETEAGEPDTSTLTMHQSTAAAALRFAEDNARAKIAAARMVDGEDEEDDYDSPGPAQTQTVAQVSPAAVKQVAMGPVAAESIMARRGGPGGRKGKIISGARRQTTGGIGGGAGFKAANVSQSSPANGR